MNEERTNYDKQMNQIYQVYTPQSAGTNFTCAGWCKSQGLGPPVTGTWMGTAPSCQWSCGDWPNEQGTNPINPNVAYKFFGWGPYKAQYNCSACLSARTWNTYVGLNPSRRYGSQDTGGRRPDDLADAELGGNFTDFGDSCGKYNGKVCCCDGTPYTGNE